MLNRVISLISSNNINKEELIQLIPELNECEKCECNHPAHCLNILDHSLELIKLVDDVLLKIVLLFHDIGKPKAMRKDNSGITRFHGHPEESVNIAKEILLRLGIDNDRLNLILILIKYHNYKIELDMLEEIIHTLGPSTVKMLIEIQKAYISTHANWYANKKMPYLYILEEEYNNLINRTK